MSLWKPGINRIKSGEVRMEEGKNVKTIFGNDLVLDINYTCDYNEIIELILDSCDFDYKNRLYGFDIVRKYEVENKIFIDRELYDVKPVGPYEGYCMLFKNYWSFKSHVIIKFNNINFRLEEDEYYRIIEHIAKHLSKRQIIKGITSNPILYYLGSFNDEDADKIVNFMRDEIRGEGISFLKIVSRTFNQPSIKFDVCFTVNYKSTILYDDIIKKSIEIIKTLV